MPHTQELAAHASTGAVRTVVAERLASVAARLARAVLAEQVRLIAEMARAGRGVLAAGLAILAADKGAQARAVVRALAGLARWPYTHKNGVTRAHGG